MSILGLFANEEDMLLAQLQCRMGCHGHHAILYNPNTFKFWDNNFLAYSGRSEQYRINDKLSLGARQVY